MSERLTMNLDEVKYIIGSVMKYAYESAKQEKETPTSFNSGRALAYYEVLDTIYNQLDIYEQDTKNFGYPDNWDKAFLGK